MTQSSAVAALVPIWQRVLQQSSVDANDNFFDLGGTASSASKLFEEIAKTFGRDLPPALICTAPTVETLAALLQNPNPLRIPPLLLMRAGADDLPVFIAHGLGDTVLELSGLVGKIKSRRPIYGMQARGVDGVDEPFTSIEDMAEFHLDAIKHLQRQGPYFLIGYSLGGLVTLEIAQRLSAAGERIALLALLDSYPDKSHLSATQHALLLLRLAKRRVWSLVESALTRPALNQPRSQISEDGGRNLSLGNKSDSRSRVKQRVRDAAYLALKQYRPRFYRGRIKFVKAGISTYFPDNPTAVWAHLAQQFDVETVPGNHFGMLNEQCETVGSLLSRYLSEADS
jgi:acetoacetyl-CoA synthetase